MREQSMYPIEAFKKLDIAANATRLAIASSSAASVAISALGTSERTANMATGNTRLAFASSSSSSDPPTTLLIIQ